MRVLQILPCIASESGGPVRSTLANCRALHAVKTNIRFTLVSTDEGLEDQWREELETRMAPGMDLKVFPALGHHAFIISPQLLAWLWRHVVDFDLLIVRTLFNPITSTAAWIARQRGTPYMVVPHGTLSRYTFRHRRTVLKRGYFWLVDRQTLVGASAVRFTSESERDEAPSFPGAARAWVIPHPYESKTVYGDRPECRPHQVLFLSRLHPKKGIGILLEAFQFLRAQNPSAHLVLAGAGASGFERHIRAEIHRFGLDDAVTLPGFVVGDKKDRLLAESSVFVLPSQQENFGIAVVEAMDAGLPVVISRGVDIWPQVMKARAGAIVEKCTPRAVARELSRLLESPQARREMGHNGKELVRTAFDPRTVGRELWRLYDYAAFPRRSRVPDERGPS